MQNFLSVSTPERVREGVLNQVRRATAPELIQENDFPAVSRG
jgi:hypothetical protein